MNRAERQPLHDASVDSLPTGLEWALRGLLAGEVGPDLLLVCEPEATPEVVPMVARERPAFDEAGCAVEVVESESVLVGLFASALRSGQKVAAIFSARALRRNLDALFQALDAPLPPGAAGALLLFDEPSPGDSLDAAPSTLTPGLVLTLGLPLLAPSSPADVGRLCPEALRLSRWATRPVAVWLPETLLNSAETPEAARSRRPLAAPLTRAETSDPLLLEARRRRVDTLFNPPGPGEIMPAAFVTCGPLHAALRDALWQLSVTGRFPILKISLASPVDTGPLEALMACSHRLIILDSTGSAVAAAALDVLQRRLSRRLDVPVIDLFPLKPTPATPDPAHPALLAQRLRETLVDLLPSSTAAFDPPPPPPRVLVPPAPAPPGTDLVAELLDEALQEVIEELAQPVSDRPAVSVSIQRGEAAVILPPTEGRSIVCLERRQLTIAGLASLTHALRRRLPTTFVVMPDPPGQSRSASVASVDRLMRGLLRDADAGFVEITAVDPSQGLQFRAQLREAALSDRLSILILDPPATNVAAAPPQQTADDAPADESVIAPAAASATLWREWLIRRGVRTLSQQGAPMRRSLRLPASADGDDPVCDGWDGFEEHRLQRRTRRATMQRLDRLPPPPSPTPVHRDAPAWRVHLAGGDSRRSFRQAASLLQSLGSAMGFRVQTVAGRSRAGWWLQALFTHPRPGEEPLPITPRIPFGQADLLIALDTASLAEAVDPQGPHAVADPRLTHCVTDNSTDFDPPIRGNEESSESASRAALVAWFPAERRIEVPARAVAASALGDAETAGVLLLAAAFQAGRIPALAERFEHVVASAPPAVADAVVAGRALAAGLLSAADLLPTESQPAPESLIVRRRRLVAASLRPRAAQDAERFSKLVLGTLDSVTGLRRYDPTRSGERRLVRRLIDCERFGGVATAWRFARRIRRIYAAERSVADYPVTRAVIDELSRALLIPDPIYLARNAVDIERLRSLERLYRLDRPAGERLKVYLRGRVPWRFARAVVGEHWRLGPLGCRVVARLGLLRRLPGWWERQAEYRDWVVGLVDQCALELPERSSLWLEVFRQLSRVRGSGESRRLMIRRVRAAVDSILELGGTRVAPVDWDAPLDSAELE